ncbi:hypothetical protein GJV26_28450 [Massilia dura]|uniref:Uncharacterized protein n=1 Tax=Pseudoduganella dura TaxID=321982 RepID=A0A6I3XIG4_9BURK|nr:hypothetical protein [Pseudoduganella dura]MUI16357.1 hypothetical protein [Pseudoduganella dura]GGX86207.1 hypothetical protein GCM10007386_16250 [Pseudoduganella dura]
MDNNKITLFQHGLRSILSDNAERLFDFQLLAMECAIAEGWKAFYAQEILFKEQLPAPLINELGKEYAIESLRCEIWRDVSQSGSSYRSPFFTQLYKHPERLVEYRNFLNVGALDTGAAPMPAPLDRTANTVLRQRIVTDHKHWWYESRANALDWYVESTMQAELTPPLLGEEREPVTPVRDLATALVDDAQYWKAVHQSRWNLISNGTEYGAFMKPDWNLHLMAALAPDFPYSAALSTGKRLIFVYEGDGALAWALMIDKTDGSPTYRYPPRLVLIRRVQKKKLKDDDILFANVDGWFVSRGSGARCLETELLFHLPRCRRMIEFYTPFLAEAIEYAM